MYLQKTLFDTDLPASVVNIASVPHRSPFRYPGGKTWLVPYIRRWLQPEIRQETHRSPIQPHQLIEPFAGGASVGLAAVAERFVDRVTLVEIDEDVSAVWSTVLDTEGAQWLADEIISFDVTSENVINYLARTNLTLREQAFKTILRNRMNRGGILAPGAGLLKSGENGKGLRSRWYPTTLQKRILNINAMREQISFITGNGVEILHNYSQHTDAVFFIDPPYTIAGKKAGKRLYIHFELDHEALFRIVSQIQGDFLLTYDEADEVRALARQFNFDVEAVPMKNTHHAEMFELLIGPDLDWLRRFRGMVR